MDNSNFLSIITYSLIVIVVPFVLYVCSKLDTSKKRIFGYIIVIGIATLVPAFRDTTGTDSRMYKSLFFTGNPGFNRWVSIEKGYMAINNISSRIMPYWLFLFIINFFIIFLIVLALDKYYRNIINFYISFLILYSGIYYQSFNIMRQCIALAFCFVAIVFFVHDRLLFSFLLILFASIFHYSALICLLIYLAKPLYNNRFRTIFIILSAVIVLVLITHRDLFGQLILKITGNSYYAGYVTRDSFSGGRIITYFVKIFPILLISMVNYKNIKREKNMTVLFGLMLIGYLVSALGSVLDTQVGRIGLYFTSLNIIILGFCGSQDISIKGTSIVISKDIMASIIIMYYMINFVISICIQGYGELLPYVPFM